MTEVRCQHCGRFLLSTNCPWGRVTAYCKGCRQMRTVLLGKPPESKDSEQPGKCLTIQGRIR